MYRFLFSSKWLGYLLLAAIFAAACVFLGRWQMDRRAESLEEINRITTNYSAEPVDFLSVKEQFLALSPEREWTQVRLVGRYDVDGQRIVRNRPLNGQPGYEVVVPFRLQTGETVIVDRGWLPIGNNTAGHPDNIPAPPAGDVTAVVRLKSGEPQLERSAPPGQLPSIHLPAYQAELGYPVLTGAYGQLAGEDPAPAEKPVGFPKPSVNEGTHLSYSLQWFAFGVLMFVAFGYAARQQARNAAIDAEDDEAQPRYAAAQGARPGPPPRKRKAPTAEEEEDAILDRQGF